jgi:hypothetical protein
MSETASGFVRVATLLLVSAVFAIIWRGDRHAQQQFVAARQEAAERAEMLAHRSAHQDAAEQLHAVAQASSPQVRQAAACGGASRIARVEIEMELPAGITAGTYQVVGQSGQLQKIRVLTGESPAQEQDLYVLEQTGGGRQYFIRISTDSGPAAVQTAYDHSAPQR